MADETPSNAISARSASSRILSKKAANRIAAAKAYCVAMEKAGEDVPQWVKELAKRAN